MNDLFLGHPLEFWRELERRAEELNVVHLIEALSEANSKVRYYERMLDQINQYRNIVTKS